MKRAIIYERKPTTLKESKNIVEKSEELRRFTTKLGYEIAGVYTDGCSGRLHPLKRPALRSLLERVSDKDFEVLVLTDYARLSRDISTLIGTRNFFRNHNIQIITLYSKGVTK